MAEKLTTLPQVMQYWADHEPDKDSFIFVNKYGEKIVLKSKDLYLMAGRFASRLHNGGFAPGDIIANGLPNSPERVVTDFGIVMAGCITMNCQGQADFYLLKLLRRRVFGRRSLTRGAEKFAYLHSSSSVTDEAITVILEKDGSDFWNTATVSKCKGIIVPATTRDSAFQLLSPFLHKQQASADGSIDMTVPKAPALKKIYPITRKNSCTGSEKVALDTKPFLEDLLSSNEEVFMANCSPSDDAYIFLTSGTTGYSKLVPRSHSELLRASRSGITGPAKTFFSSSQLGWGGGFPYNFFSSGGPIIVQDALEGKEAKTGPEVWAMLEKEQCEGALILASFVVEMMAEDNEKNPPYKLKILIVTGQPIKKNVAAAAGVLADLVVVIYASTETGSMANLVVKDPLDFKDNACGYPSKGVQIRIVDEQMQDLPPGNEGSVLVKSENNFRHYYNFTPDKPVFTEDGWFMIQDRGMVDEKGVFYVSCRDGDVITQDNVLIYLSWPEGVLAKCPKINDVKVVALKDKDGVDKLCACVARQKGVVVTEQEILDFYNNHFTLSQGSQSQFKPYLSHVLLYDMLPATQNGKTDKKKMKADAMEKFGYIFQ